MQPVHAALASALDAQGGSRASIAKTLGIHESHLSKICNGQRRPSLVLAVKFERLTHGRVRAVDWVPADKLPVVATTEATAA